MADGEWEALFVQWQRWLAALVVGDFRPCVQGGSGRISVLGSHPSSAVSVHQLVDEHLRVSHVSVKQCCQSTHRLPVNASPSAQGHP